nr:unnamed protein product [Digitaria exilis]
MAGMMLSSSTGAMNSTIAKLSVLLGDQYKMFKGVRKEIEFLKHELSYMNAVVQIQANNESLDTTTKVWRDNIA